MQGFKGPAYLFTSSSQLPFSQQHWLLLERFRLCCIVMWSLKEDHTLVISPLFGKGSLQNNKRAQSEVALD